MDGVADNTDVAVRDASGRGRGVAFDLDNVDNADGDGEPLLGGAARRVRGGLRSSDGSERPQRDSFNALQARDMAVVFTRPSSGRPRS